MNRSRTEQLREIMARLAALTAPDHDLDAEIFRALGNPAYGIALLDSDVPRYTENLHHVIKACGGRGGWQVFEDERGTSCAFVGRGRYEKAKTPAVALCLALLHDEIERLNV